MPVRSIIEGGSVPVKVYTHDLEPQARAADQGSAVADRVRSRRRHAERARWHRRHGRQIPEAYKDIDKVMTDQADLVEVVHTLRQVVCVKG